MAPRIRSLLLAGIAVAAGLAAPASAQRNDPLPRVSDAFCPGVAGLPVNLALTMVDRIRANAEAVGVRLANPDDCRPNLIVAVVDDGQAYLQEMNRAGSLVDMVPSERRDLLADSGPVHVFSRVLTRTRDGQPVPDPDNLVDIPEARGWMAHSKIYTATRKDIVYTLVLFDRAAIGPMNGPQLADYATVRALMGPNTPSVQRGDTILSLFDRSATSRPAEMSAGDRTQLAALYRSLPNLPAAARLAELDKAAGPRPNPE